MEYVLLTLLIIESGAFVYYVMNNKNKVPTVLTIEQKEKERQERIEKDFAKLFNYTETIATRGYKDEE